MQTVSICCGTLTEFNLLEVVRAGERPLADGYLQGVFVAGGVDRLRHTDGAQGARAGVRPLADGDLQGVCDAGGVDLLRHTALTEFKLYVLASVR